jgi:hypothetical protein
VSRVNPPRRGAERRGTRDSGAGVDGSGGASGGTYRESTDGVDGERVDLFVRHDGRVVEEGEMGDRGLSGSDGFVCSL